MCDRCDTIERLSQQKTALIARLEQENKRLREEIAALLAGDAMLPESLLEETDGRR